MEYNFGDLALIENQDSVTVYASKDVKSVVIPKEFNGKPVTVINGWALAGSVKLESVVIPDTITKINSNAFGGCMSLESIIVPKSVSEMGVAVFAGCEKINIYCEAESLQDNWNALWNTWERPVYWYSENKPEKAGNFWHYVNGAPKIW